jgi:hypothetical protein
MQLLRVGLALRGDQNKSGMLKRIVRHSAGSSENSSHPSCLACLGKSSDTVAFRPPTPHPQCAFNLSAESPKLDDFDDFERECVRYWLTLILVRRA